MSECYPRDILPRKEFKRNLNINDLLHLYPKLLIVRRFSGNLSEHIDNTTSGPPVYLPTIFQGNMANLSLNLSGGIFDTNSSQHLRFLPKHTDASRAWNGEDIPEYLYVPKETYEYNDDCHGLCFFCADVHEQKFPFYRHFATKEERDEFYSKTLKATTDKEKEYDAHIVEAFVNKNKKVVVYPRLKVHHAPTMVNYWHVTLDTYRPTDTEPVSSSEKTNSTDRKMFKHLKMILLKQIMIDKEPDYHLEEKDYILSITPSTSLWERYKRRIMCWLFFCRKIFRKTSET